nr:helix-turn-helix transcriptional regulator [Nannocystis pusilla]
MLARVRTELNLTQEAAAAAAGVDVRTYRRYESGAVNEAAEGFVVRNASRRRLLGALSRELGIAESELVIAAEATVQEAAFEGWRPCHAHAAAGAPLRRPRGGAGAAAGAGARGDRGGGDRRGGQDGAGGAVRGGPGRGTARGRAAGVELL